MQLRKSQKPSANNGKYSFVLIVGDEGGILVQLQGKKVIKRLFAAAPESDQLRLMNELMETAPKAPILVLVDMMDQSYVRQTLPPVSSFSVGKIISRRLNKDFAADDIKGYIVIGREKSGRRDWNYLMASLANTGLLQKWLDFAVERTNSFKGIGLVPLECQTLLNLAEPTILAASGKDAAPTEWHILVCHHKVGGFRQVVLKQGQLVFTRLAHIVGEPTPDVIAGNIEQELINTLEYLKRLGLQDMSRLTITIVASGEIKSVFEPKAIRAARCSFFTPYEFSEICSFKDAAKHEDHFGDVVIASWIATRRKLLLRLFTSSTVMLKRIGVYILASRAVAAAGALAILGWTGMSGMAWYEATQATEESRRMVSSLSAQFAVEESNKKTLPAKMELISGIAALHRHYNKPTLDPLVMALQVNKGLDDLALVKNYHWQQMTVNDDKSSSGDKRKASADFEVTLTTNPEMKDEYIASAHKLVKSIGSAFPKYEITNSELPGAMVDTTALTATISETGESQVTQNVKQVTSIKFTVKGPFDKIENKPMDPLAARGMINQALPNR